MSIHIVFKVIECIRFASYFCRRRSNGRVITRITVLPTRMAHGTLSLRDALIDDRTRSTIYLRCAMWLRNGAVVVDLRDLVRVRQDRRETKERTANGYGTSVTRRAAG